MSPNIPKFPKNSCDRAGLEIVLVSKQIGGKEQPLSYGGRKGDHEPLPVVIIQRHEAAEQIAGARYLEWVH